MRVSVSFHGITKSSQQQLRAMFDSHATRIGRHLQSFQEDLVRLEGRVEKNPNHHLYCISLRLKLPSRVLAASEEDHDLRKIFCEAFDELERRTQKHLARLRGEHTWRRVDRSAVAHVGGMAPPRGMRAEL